MGRCVLSERLASALRVVGTLCAVACVLACTFVDIVLVLECSVSSELGSVSFCVFRVQRVGFRVLLRLSGVAWVGSRVSVSFCCSTGLFASVRVLPFGVGASRSYLIHSFIHFLATVAVRRKRATTVFGEMWVRAKRPSPRPDDEATTVGVSGVL